MSLYSSMKLSIQMPSRIFLEQEDVVKIVAESTRGSFGILPNRLDCIAYLVPGIFLYELAGKDEFYIAVDCGILVKDGDRVSVSVHNAIGDVPLADLPSVVDEQLRSLDEQEMALRNSISLLQSSMIGSFGRSRS